MDKMETAVLLSGGLDSSVALHWAHRNHRVRVALSFDYASNHAERELKCAAWQAASLGIEHRVIDISSISSHLKSALLSGADDIPDGSYDEELMKQTVVPFRNGIFLSIAAGVAESCGAQQLVIAAHSGDHSIYPDCRECLAVHITCSSVSALQGPAITMGRLSSIPGSKIDSNSSSIFFYFCSIIFLLYRYFSVSPEPSTTSVDKAFQTC